MTSGSALRFSDRARSGSDTESPPRHGSSQLPIRGGRAPVRALRRAAIGRQTPDGRLGPRSQREANGPRRSTVFRRRRGRADQAEKAQSQDVDAPNLATARTTPGRYRARRRLTVRSRFGVLAFHRDYNTLLNTLRINGFRVSNQPHGGRMTRNMPEPREQRFGLPAIEASGLHHGQSFPRRAKQSAPTSHDTFTLMSHMC